MASSESNSSGVPRGTFTFAISPLNRRLAVFFHPKLIMQNVESEAVFV